MLIRAGHAGHWSARRRLHIYVCMVAGLLVGCGALNLWARGELRNLKASQPRDTDTSNGLGTARQLTNEAAPAAFAVLEMRSLGAHDFLKSAHLLSQRNAATVRSSSTQHISVSPSRMGGEEVQLIIVGTYKAVRSVLSELHGAHAQAFLTAVTIRATAGPAELEMAMSWWLPNVPTGGSR